TWTYKQLDATLYVDTGSAPPVTTLVGPADNSVVTTLSPTLSVSSVTDPDGEAVEYCFKVATGADAKSGVVVDSGCLSSPTWTVRSHRHMTRTVTWCAGSDASRRRPMGCTS